VAVPAYGSQLDWRPCAKVANGWNQDDQATECAMVQVPLDYANPGGRQIKIAVTRLKATDQAHRRGVVLVNPGGPGSEGDVFPAELAATKLAPVNRYYDLIGFDIRGTGYSDKIDCLELSADNHLRPPPGLSDKERSKFLVDETGAAAKTCAEKDLDFTRSLTTENVARDMDRIRAALGERKISYFGISWGTALGASYRSQFDGNVDRMLLDSVLAPGQAISDADDQVKASEALFRDFAAWMARYDSVLHLGRTQADVVTTVLALRDELTAHPRSTFDGDWVDSQLLSAQANWASAAKALAAVRAGGTPSTPAAAPSRPALSGIDTRGYDGGFVDGGLSFMIIAINCNDSPGQRDFEAGYQHGQELARLYPVGGSRADYARCYDWPLPAQPATLRHGVSPLQLSGHAFETNTVFGWAQQMQRTIGGSLLTVRNDVHSSLDQIACGAKGVDFLVDGVTTNGSCPGDPIPTP
jgi:pimeloyl-ACP methyl ester carboxylesterase